MTCKKEQSVPKPGLLLAANWDSDVGYAWWLMESYWAAIAEEYSAKHHCILAYPSISAVPDTIQNAPITVTRADFSQLGANLFFQLKYLIKHNVRVIYFSDKPVRSWVYGLYRLAGVKKILVHDHTPGLRTPPSMWKRLLKKALCRIPFMSADVCIGATPFVRQRLIEVACVPRHRCFAVANGISTDLPVCKSIHAELSIPSDRAVIITAARANRYKGGFFALEVLAEIRNRGVEGWHYVYLGDGPDLHALRERTKALGLEDLVSFPGRVDGAVSLIQSAAISFQPSSGEVGYSLSILEYMLCGVPPVVPSNPSVCGATEDGNTGIIYEDGDVAAAADGIVALLQNPKERKRLGENGRQKVITKCSLSNAHKSLIEIFDALFAE